MKKHHIPLIAALSLGFCFATPLASTSWAQQGVQAVAGLPQEKKPIYNIDRVEPGNWWVGMVNPSVQLMVHGKNIAYTKVSIDYPGVSIKKVSSLDNPNYVFIDLDLQGAKAGTFPIRFEYGKKKEMVLQYTLKEKTPRISEGINGGDVMYLIMPDRFANGDPSNDKVSSMLEGPDRTHRDGRHGGDIKGITQNLDYIKNLGATTVWLNPVQENNEKRYSYHGYAITDFYKVDPRFGDNQAYKDMVEAAHKRGMKVIMDLVFNHIGDNHWWMKDMPSKSWVHQWSEFTKTNFKGEILSDPNASDYDREVMAKGWFDNHMPDMAQEDPYLAKYLTQMTIWWIEYSGIDGIRMDTYMYNDKQMMAEWVKAVKAQFPNFYIVGEVWLPEASFEAYWKKGRTNQDGYASTLESVSDFPLWEGFKETFRDDKSIDHIWKRLAQDFLYEDPNGNKIFLGNHDVDRFFGIINKDMNKAKMATTILLTTRGIPQLFYGDEILMAKTGEHGDLREDFPGGWAGDARNAFTKEGRTAQENEYFDYLSNILHWRKEHVELFKSGKLKHWAPQDQVYAYTRSTGNQSAFVLVNNNDKPVTIQTTRYQEALSGYKSGKDIISGQPVNLSNITVPAKSSMIIELSK